MAKKAKKVQRKAARTKTARSAARVEAVPRRYGTATPTLIVSPCTDALTFYEKALGARVLNTMQGPGGTVMHAEIKIGDSIIMLSDEMPPMPGMPATRKTPRNAGAITGGVMLYVKDVDRAFQRAVEAGGTGVMSPADMFWGDRYAQIEDPFGHVWAIATHKKNLTNRQMAEAAAKVDFGATPA